MEDPSPSHFEYYNQLTSPTSHHPQPLSPTMIPYLSPSVPSHSPTGTDEDLYGSLSPDAANHPHRWQQQQRPSSPQPIPITSPFITPVGKTDPN